MSKHKTRWTSQEEALLEKLVMQGKSDTDIANRIGRSQHAIMRKRKYGLCINRRRRWTPNEDARLKQLFSEDKTLLEAGRLLNRTESAIERRRERLGLKRIPVKLSKHNPADIAQLVKFKMAGWTHERIAKLFGVHTSYISNLLVVNGFERFCEVKPNRRRMCPRWTEVELRILRKCLGRKTPLLEIYRKLSHRSHHAIHQKARQITRYWLSPAEQAERKRLRKKQLRVY